MVEPSLPSPDNWPQPIDAARASVTRTTLRKVLETVLDGVRQ
jgi:hypothetical protein